MFIIAKSLLKYIVFLAKSFAGKCGLSLKRKYFLYGGTQCLSIMLLCSIDCSEVNKEF